jgi:hypothetical protein
MYTYPTLLPIANSQHEITKEIKHFNKTIAENQLEH